MKKIMYILITITIGLSFNSNASSIYEGKWYQFTSDFIQNCFDGFEATQEGVSESAGKSSSFANSLTRKELEDCMPSSPYLDTDPQVDPINLLSRRSCKSTYISGDKINLPSASDGQTVGLISSDGLVKAKYKCNNGNWSSAFDKVDVRDTESHCSAKCLKWDSEGNVAVCDGAFEVVGNVNICGAVLPEKSHGRVIKANAGSNHYSGYAKFACNNGNWTLLSTPTCEIQTCTIADVNGNNDVVFWSDNEAVSNDTGTDTNIGGEDSYVLNPLLKERVKCSSEINSTNGIVGTATYFNPDRRIFKSRLEAEQNHKNIVGTANFTCYKGNWRVDNNTSVCRRDTSVNCNNTRIVAIENGENILGYFCQ